MSSLTTACIIRKAPFNIYCTSTFYTDKCMIIRVFFLVFWHLALNVVCHSSQQRVLWHYSSTLKVSIWGAFGNDLVSFHWDRCCKMCDLKSWFWSKDDIPHSLREDMNSSVFSIHASASKWPGYGLYGPWFKYQQEHEISLLFKTSRPALRRTQPPTQRVPGDSSQGVKRPWPERTTHLHLTTRLTINGAIPLLPLYVLMARTSKRLACLCYVTMTVTS